MGSSNFWVQTNFGFETNFGSERFWIQENLGSQKFWVQKMWIQSKCEAKKTWDETKSGSKKNSCPQKFLFKIFWSNDCGQQELYIPTILDPNKFLTPNNLGCQKILESKKDLYGKMWAQRKHTQRNFLDKKASYLKTLYRNLLETPTKRHPDSY